MSDENEVIAEWLEAHGHGNLAWEPAKTCPQGHENNDEPYIFAIGQLCGTCEARWLLLEPDGTATNDDDEVRARDKELAEHRHDIHWHPEFRIQRVAHDFTDPRWLGPAIDAWLAGYPRRRWTAKFNGGEWVAYGDGWMCYPPEAKNVKRGIAERDAVAAAIGTEKGGVAL